VPTTGRRLSELQLSVSDSPNYRRWLLTITLAGIFCTSFPTGILTISIKVMAGDLHATPNTITWSVTGPLLVAAIGMPMLGRLGDLRGHRGVFLAGTLVSGIFALLTAAAWDPLSLIAFRTLGQIGAAAAIPSTFAMLFQAFPPHERVRASAFASASLSGASVVGIVVGGPLIGVIGWRPIFLMQAAIAFAALVGAVVVLPRVQRTFEKTRQDYAGAAVLALGTFCLTFGINRLSVWGPTPVIIACLAVVPVCAWLLVIVERRCESPLLPIHVLSSRNRRLVVLASATLDLGWMGNFIVTPLLLQSVLGLSVVYASLATLPRTGSIVCAAPFAGRIGIRFGERKLLIGSTLSLVVVLAMLGVAAQLQSLVVVLVVLSLSGLGYGAASPALVSSMSDAVAEGDFGLAVSLQQTSRQIGGVIGMSLFSAVAADATTPGPFLLVYLIAAGFALVTALLGMGLARETRPKVLATTPSGVIANS
jgi:MFS family permease